jgi:AcrR family transcriptional regulator
MNKINDTEKKISRKEQAGIRRNQIIDAMRSKDFRRKGLRQDNDKDISEAAGTSLGLMYHYFKNKEELLIAVSRTAQLYCPLRDIMRVTDKKICSRSPLHDNRQFLRAFMQQERAGQYSYQGNANECSLSENNDGHSCGGVNYLATISPPISAAAFSNRITPMLPPALSYTAY